MGGAVVVNGRTFSRATLERIEAWVAARPEGTRRELAAEVCRWEGWYASNGKAREMGCRVALLELSRRGQVVLPEARRQVRRKVEGLVETAPETVTVEGRLEEIEGLEVVLVRGARHELSQRWKHLVATHHYLGYRPLCGAQIRYLVRCDRGEIGALAFSASALQLKARDGWIGWTPAQRRAHREQVVSNSRFVVCKGVKVKNLASHVLAMVVRRLPDDWEKIYGVRPVLVETFVDGARFKGSCYKAANWTYVGKTSGRGRQDRYKRTEQSIKDIYVYELEQRWRERLLAALPPTGRAAKQQWAAEEFAEARLHDRRHHKRLLALANAFAGEPSVSIPQACGSRAATKAAYRFFASKRVNMHELLSSHTEASVERIAREKPAVVLAVQDSTTFNYSTHSEMEGLGLIGTTPDGAVGVWMHETMLYDEQGVPLGLLDVQLWSRDPAAHGKRHTRKQRPIEDKESIKWLNSFRAAAGLQRRLAGISTVLSVGDREADVYELFALAQSDPDHPRLLIRAERNRRLAEEQQCLWPKMENEPVAAEYLLEIPRRKKRKVRQVRMGLRFAEVTLQAPQQRSKLGTVKVWAVLAQQINPAPPDKPLQWMLLTTLPVHTAEQARQCVEYYRLRWRIEEFHRTLKSGCRIEDRLLTDRHSWENCLAIDLVVAWRVERIKYLSRNQPQIAPTEAFTDDECEAIELLFPKHAGSLDLKTTTALVGQLGGHQGRKGDGPPGSTVLWRGLQKLENIVLGVRIARQSASHARLANQTSPVSRRPRYG